jgi:hypothetical protein
VARALEVAAADFLDVMVFFILGVAISALFSTAVNQELIIPFALNDWVATFSLMGFAALLSLCSTSDAFIAATLIAFPGVAKLAFLVFGPMFDLKLLFIYSAVFRKRFIAGLGQDFLSDRPDLRAIESPRNMKGSFQRLLSAGIRPSGSHADVFWSSGRLASYLHPSFQVWTAVSGVILLVLAGALWFLPPAEESHCHRLRPSSR